MRVLIVSKSDSTGGAAVVARRLMEALRAEGVDARMLVAEKLTDSPHVALIASPWRIKASFIADRLPIAFANGFNRSTLFKMDGAFAGIDISKHPWVKEADFICLNWINQGVLSMRDIAKLVKMGKKVYWTMHDMWNMTGVCHHAGACGRFQQGEECGHCPLLGGNPQDFNVSGGSGGSVGRAGRASANDISHKTWLRKKELYELRSEAWTDDADVERKVASLLAGGDDCSGLEFVAVSSWLAERAKKSSLLGEMKVHVIPNAFQLPAKSDLKREELSDAPAGLRMIMGAARLDDDVKGFPILIAAMKALKRKYPEIAEKAKLTLFGDMKSPELLKEIEVEVDYRGRVCGERAVRELYLKSDMVLSTSHYETLPGTLIEGQAYGCYPVSFPRGGQRDIIEHPATGWLAEWDDDAERAGENFADGIARGYSVLMRDKDAVRRKMYASVARRFSAESVARRWKELFR